MPSPCRFRAETVIHAGIEAVYSFHEDPHNILQISPAWQQVRIEQAKPIASAGDEFKIIVRMLGMVSIHWHGVWREADRPNRLVDEIVRGPFTYWRHQHSFQTIAPGRTRMIDQVDYRFPGGWLGKVFGETVGRLQFRLMFADRQARTRRRLREQT